jgi:hypothetical protein
VRRESRPPPEELPPASGPKERRDEFLKARGLDEEGAEYQDRLNEPGEDVDNSCPDDGAMPEAEAEAEADADLEEESKDS